MLVNQDYPNYYHIKTEMTVIHLKIFVYFSQRQRLILIRVLVLCFVEIFIVRSKPEL